MNRALNKSITYRLMNSLIITPAIVFTFTGKLNISFGVGIVELLVKTAGFYVHEKLWEVRK